MMEFRTLGVVELRGAGGETLHALAAQPRRVALLAYLCVATPRGFHRRDALLALFWPDSDQAHARSALRNAVHFLRRALGAETVSARGDEEISIDSRQLWCDAVAFDNAVEGGRAEEAVPLYRGDFLAGFFIREAPEWERWLEGERARFRADAARMAHMMAERSETERNITAAVSWASRAVELTGDDERAFRRLLELFDRVDDRAGALRAYEAFAQRLQAEYGAEPALETRALAERIRTRAIPLRTASPMLVTEPEMIASLEPEVAPADLRVPLSRRVRLLEIVRTRRAAAIVAALALGTAASLPLARNARTAHAATSPYRIAVFPFRVMGDTGWKFLQEGAMDLLSGAMDGVGDVRRVDPAALTSRLRRDGETEIDPALARRISAELGAERYVLGTVVGEADRAVITASLYRIDREAEPIAVARTGTGRDSMSQRITNLGHDLLKDQRVGVGPRLSRPGSIHATSYLAEREYFRGESMLRRGVYDSAGSAYERAVREDSTFALAWYRLALARSLGAPGDGMQSIDAAMRHRAMLAERDRLLMEGLHGHLHGNGKRAEERSLAAVTAYPDEVEGWQTLGTTRWWYAWQLGRSPALARPAIERALVLDPGSRETLHTLHVLSLLERRYAEVMPSAKRAYSREGPLAFNLMSATAVAAFAAGDTARQQAVIQELEGSAEFTIFQSATFVASYTDNLAGARRIAELMTESSSRSRAGAARGHVLLALIDLAGGSRHSAQKEFAAAAALDTTGAFIYEGMMAGVPQLAFRDEEMKAVRDRLTRWRPMTREGDVWFDWLVMPVGLARYLRLYALGLLSANLGDDDAALSYANALRNAHERSDSAGLLPDLALEIRALVAERSGDTSTALAILEHQQLRVQSHYQVASPVYERPVGRFLRAELLHARGRDTEALGWYGSLASLSMIEFVFLAPAYLHQGEIYERARQPARAVEYYSRFVERWQTCDPDLRPLVDDARKRILRLTGNTRLR